MYKALYTSYVTCGYLVNYLPVITAWQASLCLTTVQVSVFENVFCQLVFVKPFTLIFCINILYCRPRLFRRFVCFVRFYRAVIYAYFNAVIIRRWWCNSGRELAPRPTCDDSDSAGKVVGWSGPSAPSTDVFSIISHRDAEAWNGAQTRPDAMDFQLTVICHNQGILNEILELHKQEGLRDGSPQRSPGRGAGDEVPQKLKHCRLL